MIAERIGREVDVFQCRMNGNSNNDESLKQRLEALKSEKASLEKEIDFDLSGFNLIESFGKINKIQYSHEKLYHSKI
jgi:hypothetical protein